MLERQKKLDEFLQKVKAYRGKQEDYSSVVSDDEQWTDIVQDCNDSVKSTDLVQAVDACISEQFDSEKLVDLPQTNTKIKKPVLATGIIASMKEQIPEGRASSPKCTSLSLDTDKCCEVESTVHDGLDVKNSDTCVSNICADGFPLTGICNSKHNDSVVHDSIIKGTREQIPEECTVSPKCPEDVCAERIVVEVSDQESKDRAGSDRSYIDQTPNSDAKDWRQSDGPGVDGWEDVSRVHDDSTLSPNMNSSTEQQHDGKPVQWCPISPK